jgi:hypothetical protein
MWAEKVAVLAFEEVREEYRRKDERGIPMSVRERYENELTEMRHKIRESNRSRGKRLGEMLVGMGVLDQEELEHGLTEQQQRGKGELLGEVLVALGLIKEEALLSALRMQVSEN